MALRKPFVADSSEGFHVEIPVADSLDIGSIEINASGTGIVMNSKKITGLGAGTVANDALAYGQAGNLSSLSITSGGNITVAGGGELTGLPTTPSGDTAAVSKAYVDSVAQGLDVHDSVVAATTASGTLATDYEDGDAIDGVTLSTGDRILIKDQGDTANGIYIVQASGAPVRADDFDTGYGAAGAFLFVEQGTLNGDNGFVCTNNNGTDVVGTHTLSFTQFSGAGQIVAGNGITKSANTLSVDPDTETGGNIQAVNVTANGVGVDISAVAGTGLEADGSANLRLAAQGNGIAGGAGSTLSVDPDSETGGNTQPVSVGANGVGVDISAIAGTGIEADGSANLRLAAQGNGIAGGAGSVLSVDADSETGGNIQPVNITANGVGLDISAIAGSGLVADGSANLDINLEASNPTLQVSSDELGLKIKAGGGLAVDASGVYVSGSDEAARVEETLTTATDTTANGDPVYVNGAATVGKADADTDAKCRVIGIIRTGGGAAGATPDVVGHGRCAGILSGATANTPYFLQSGGGIGTSIPSSGRTIMIGYALNATDLYVRITDYGKKAA